MNTLKFANANRVYFRLGQPEYTSLTQKFNNIVGVDLVLSNVNDIRLFLMKAVMESVLWPESHGLLGSHKDLP